MSSFLQPYALWSAKLLCPWDSPGKNTGPGFQGLLQGIFLTRSWTHISCGSCIAGNFFTIEPLGEPVRNDMSLKNFFCQAFESSIHAFLLNTTCNHLPKMCCLLLSKLSFSLCSWPSSHIAIDSAITLMGLKSSRFLFLQFISFTAQSYNWRGKGVGIESLSVAKY